jgi:uncharacterized protein (TIGR02996 family)
MNHPDWPAFLAAILADPDDDTARLVAADFLEENDDTNRAAFIRIQVALARLEATGQGKSLEADHLRAKERAFLGPLSTYRPLWAANECPELARWKPRGGGRTPLEAMAVEGADRLTWRRGFVESVTCPVMEWHQHGAAVRKRNPIRQVTLMTRDAAFDRGRWWALLPLLRGLKLVVLRDLDIPATDFLAWLRSQLPGVKVSAIDDASGGIDLPPRRTTNGNEG